MGSTSDASESAKLQFLGSLAGDDELLDAAVVSFFLQERTRREKQWAAEAGKVDGGPMSALFTAVTGVPAGPVV